MNEHSEDVIIVGAGMAGLTCAWKCQLAGMQPLVMEASRHLGGNVYTEEEQGFRYECGPHTFLSSADYIFDMIEALGIQDQLEESQPAAHARYIVREGKLYKVFSGPWSFLTSGLLSLKGKLVLGCEPFRSGKTANLEDSAQIFFERRFGKEAARILAGAFISGVYAGDPAALSAPAAFPLFWGFEQDYGSMIVGSFFHGKQRAKQRDPSKPKRKGLYSCKRGLGTIAETIGKQLPKPVMLDTAVTKIDFQDNRYLVYADDREYRAKQVVLACPPHRASEITKQWQPDLAETLDQIELAPMAVVHMGFNRALHEIPNGFGFLVPRGQDIRTLGVLFPSKIFSGRCAADQELLAGFIGGSIDNKAHELSDQELLSIVTNDLKTLCGLDTQPDFVKIKRYSHAIPQLTHGHLERVERMEHILRDNPGFHVAGNYIKGVGLKDAVLSGMTVAQAVIEKTKIQQGNTHAV